VTPLENPANDARLLAETPRALGFTLVGGAAQLDLDNAALEQKIDQTSRAECTTWLENQFGTQARAINPQVPMPLRVIWSASGPKDDPSMYSRPRGTF
jgi:hypothetical protein